MALPPKLLDGNRLQYTIGRLADMVSANATQPDERQLLGLMLPPWQRPEVWTISQKRHFIEGVFLGFGCGYYVTNGFEFEPDGTPAPMSGWLLDGQQRISAIRDFLENGLTVFDGITYQGLTRPEQLRFLRTGFSCIELDYTDNEDVLKELYNRLNFSGTPHTEEQRANTVRQG